MNFWTLITAGLGTTGAVLGIINTINQIMSRRVRLQVTPTFAFGFGWLKQHGDLVAINVINLSDFPVYIDEVGLFMGSWKDKRIVFARSITHDNEPVTRKLDPRESFSVYQPISEFAPQELKHVTKAYVKTACGIIRARTSPALKGIVKKAKINNL